MICYSVAFMKNKYQELIDFVSYVGTDLEKAIEILEDSGSQPVKVTAWRKGRIVVEVMEAGGNVLVKKYNDAGWRENVKEFPLAPGCYEVVQDYVEGLLAE